MLSWPELPHAASKDAPSKSRKNGSTCEPVPRSGARKEERFDMRTASEERRPEGRTVRHANRFRGAAPGRKNGSTCEPLPRSGAREEERFDMRTGSEGRRPAPARKNGSTC